MNTRSFRKELGFLNRKNITRETTKDAIHAVHKTLMDENKDIEYIKSYLLHHPPSLGIRIYFLIHNPTSPPDKHMLLQLQGSADYVATYLEPHEQKDTDILDKFFIPL